MCEVFISADPHSYDSRTRSVRLHGVVTSIRLENLFWLVLEEIARRDGMGVVQLIERLYDELVSARGEVGNFASFLRVTCLRYLTLRHQKPGERPSLAVVGTLPPTIREQPIRVAAG